MLQLNMDKTISIQLIPYTQCDETPGTFVLNDRAAFDKHIEELNAIIADDAQLRKQYDDFVRNKTEDYLFVYQQPQNRTLRRLANKGLLPSQFASEVLPQPMYKDKHKLLTLLNSMQCEAHSDIMRKILTDLKSEL